MNQDFGLMVKRASTGGLTTLNQLRVFLWLGRNPGRITARRCADGTGVTPSQVTGVFKALEYLGHLTLEVDVNFEFGIRRSALVVTLTDQGRGWLEMILMEVAA